MSAGQEPNFPSQLMYILDALRWIVSAWDSVEQSIIMACFSRVGFPVNANPTEQFQDDLQVAETIQSLPENVRSELVSAEEITKVDEGIVLHDFARFTNENIAIGSTRVAVS